MDRQEAVVAIIGDLYAQIDVLVGQRNTVRAELDAMTGERDALQARVEEMEAKPGRKRSPAPEQKI